jgi:hypothetical protein
LREDHGRFATAARVRRARPVAGGGDEVRYSCDDDTCGVTGQLAAWDYRSRYHVTVGLAFISGLLEADIVGLFAARAALLSHVPDWKHTNHGSRRKPAEFGGHAIRHDRGFLALSAVSRLSCAVRRTARAVVGGGVWVYWLRQRCWYGGAGAPLWRAQYSSSSRPLSSPAFPTLTGRSTSVPVLRQLASRGDGPAAGFPRAARSADAADGLRGKGPEHGARGRGALGQD